MAQRTFVSCATVVAVAVIAACGGDITQPKQLPAAKFASMSSALTMALIGAFEYGIPSQSVVAHSATILPAGARTGDMGASYHAGVACPQGGRAAVFGTIADVSLGLTHYVLTDTLSDCTLDGADGVAWQLNTEPAVTTIVDDYFSGGGFTRSQTDVGTIRYSSGQLSGSCDIDLAIRDSIQFGMGGVHVHAQGRVCGRPVNKDTVVGFPWSH